MKLLFVLTVFSFYGFSVEISDDLFVKTGDEEEWEDEGILEYQNLIIETARTKETAIIKRESLLDHVVANTDKQLETKTALEHKAQKDERSPAGDEESSRSFDYGDYELRWHKEEIR